LKSEAILWDQWLQETAEASAEPQVNGIGSAHPVRAIQVLKALVETQREPVLVNRDLHRDNVLRASREPWLVIDPKPIVAEREFALANRLPMFGATEIEDANADVVQRLSSFADTLGLDAHRVRGWAFVRAVLWSLDGGRLAPHFSRVARLLGETIRC
jgi:streptomycin 6-kinase